MRAIDVFVDELDLRALGFSGVSGGDGSACLSSCDDAKDLPLRLINQIQSSRRLERETQRNVELMWLTGRLMPDFKTIADFRKDNGPAKQAQAATGVRALTAIADRGYFKGEEIMACEAAGVTPFVPKPLTSAPKAHGRFGKQDFVYDPDADAYRCPRGETLTWRYSNVEGA